MFLALAKKSFFPFSVFNLLSAVLNTIINTINSRLGSSARSESNDIRILINKDGEDGEVDKANILLAVGLVFWFIANIIWTYYELVLDIVSPVPSLADIFLLSAYGFLIYRLTIVYRKVGHHANKKFLTIIVIGTGLFLIYIKLDSGEYRNIQFQGSNALYCYHSLSNIPGLTVLAFPAAALGTPAVHYRKLLLNRTFHKAIGAEPTGIIRYHR